MDGRDVIQCMKPNSLLADFVVVFHLGSVTFVVLGLVLILAGSLFKWSWFAIVGFT